jgi:hypothetical protein
VYDRPMSAPGRAASVLDIRAAADEWRPQLFGGGRARGIDDPLIEPLWAGLRVLALVDRGEVLIRDLDGETIDEFDLINEELAAAVGTERLLLDAYLTPQPVQDLTGIPIVDAVEAPKAAQAINQIWLGRFGQPRRKVPEGPPPEDEGRDPLPLIDEVAIVIVDLLWLDDESLVDVPLLERKRILESVLDESTHVRRGIYVRPPVDPWLVSWRSFGFSRLAYKAANSRYLPGETNPHWALAPIPTR